MAGCGGKKKQEPKKPKEEPKLKPQTIKVLEGSTVAKDAKGLQLWKVHWMEGIVTLAEDKTGYSAVGDLQSVSGEIYKGSNVACTYASQQGKADKEKKVLTLLGGVKLIAKDPAATMYCDRMIYDGNVKIIKAYGHVRVLGTADTEGTIDELWATPDLKKIATPDMFYRQ